MNSVEDIINFLCDNNISLTAAESCTAGMVTSLLADVPGCGSVLEMGFVVYTEQAKHLCLGVNLQTIKSFGLTSEEVAREMAKGALQRSRANFAVAVTGTAESNDELDGVVCFAYAIQLENCKRVLSDTVNFSGERNQVRRFAAMHALVSIPAYHQRLIRGEGEIAR